MNAIMRGLAVAALVSALGACAYYDPAAVRGAAVGGGAYNAAAHEMYTDLGDAERAEMDWRDSENFYSKAMEAAGGGKVMPYEMSFRDSPADKVDELTAARNRITAALSAGAAEQVPVLAATAVTQWDCWFQEQEENHQPKDIAACRDGFMKAMAEIDQAMAPKPQAQPAPAPAAQPRAPDIDGIYIVYFDFDSAVLTAEARTTLDKAVADFRAARVPALEIKGHADRSGSADYNEKLSMRRAEAVGAYMGRAGVPVNLMRTSAFGESLPLVPTADGVREQRNRRVEVVFD